MKKKKRRKYTQEFKEEAVKLIINQGYSFAEAGRNLGVNPNLLSRWKKDIFDYIEIFYNNKRRHSYLGNISPKGYEKLWEMGKAA